MVGQSQCGVTREVRSGAKLYLVPNFSCEHSTLATCWLRGLCTQIFLDIFETDAVTEAVFDT